MWESVGPKRAMVGISSDAARCDGPLSLPKKAAQLVINAAKWRIESCGNSVVFLAIRVFKCWASPSSAGPDEMVTLQFVSRMSLSARDAKCLGGQHLFFPPLPGCMRRVREFVGWVEAF